MSDFVLPLDAFVRSIRVSRSTPHAFFLGAGASISSGIPSAQMCIWEWKRDIFLTNNVGLENQFAELSLTSVKQRIQRWLDKQGLYPPDAAPEEYGTYIESCFPVPEHRRAYFQEKVRAAHPYTGYKLLCLLSEAQIVKSVWTTNFDSLVARAAAAFDVTPVEVGIDSQERVVRAVNRKELMVVSLHGDYRYDRLKNTADELKSQERILEGALVDEFKETPAIVCGYSGRDASIMSAFATAYGSKGAGTLYWCVQDVSRIPSAVIDLIALARRNGRTAYVVQIHGFDDLMTRLSLHCLDHDERKRASETIATNLTASEPPRRAFHIEQSAATSILKSNAFEIECPSEILSFETKECPERHVWKWVKAQTDGKNISAVPFKGKILALGTMDDVTACFRGNVKDTVQRSPVSERDFRYEDGAVVSLMREALVRAMASECSLGTDGHNELWFTDVERKGSQAGVQYEVHESVSLFLRHLSGRQYLILKPSVKILTPTGEPVSRTIANPIKLSILGWQHNREFNEAVNKWRTRLLKAESTQKIYEFPPKCGSTFRFAIRRSPAFAEVHGAATGRQVLKVDAKLRPLIKQQGVEISEPKLLFSNKAGTGTATDVHPVRGVLNNRPFDYSLTTLGLSTGLRIGVVCPKIEAPILRNYLNKHRQRIPPSKYEADYLLAYPGFQSAFGLPLELAEPGAAGWITCPEPTEGLDQRGKAVEIAKSINRSIERIQASFSPHLVLIFFPERWAPFRGYETDDEQFDVHDFVKANSVHRGVGTQFLEQNTLADPLQCRVWWWLSLAFYVKSMRTPWVLDGLNASTAFVGLGMSVKRAAERDRRVVLGCSHIYSSRGEGLQYRLSQVENPIFYGRNPFLSRDDARRVGEQIRELFFESREKLPDRVVIHKRTRFTADEQLGLREGLHGVSQVEMLEIFVDDALRYVASATDGRGNLSEDDYPVRRGTSIKLDDFTGLVWVHGVTSAVNAGRRYYQGKRRIPAPLAIRRYAGEADLKTIAEEILGLSKMNWNTFDLYTRLPATVQSSHEIARIGSLLARFGARSYDFRLFI